MLRLFVLFLAVTCSFAGNTQSFLRGSVLDAQTGEPLAGATLQLQPGAISALTDERGRFSLRAADGQFNLEVRYLGYEEYKQTVVLPATDDLNILLKPGAVLTDAVVVTATRASDKTPTTFANINRLAIQRQNFGQDLPMMLNWMPSVVTTSDAGAGVGYTGIRIRGSDATRINVTINGIPYNDSESQSVYWVDVPDIATSTQSIQLQRGVGTSSNGAGAFGATINLQTNTRNDKAYADVINSVGSFGTHRHTIGIGSGLINDKFVFDGRVSRILSDGFIDRASSDLSSYYFAGGYYGKKTMIKAIAFGGKEITYQSWWGVPESRLRNDIAAMQETAADEGWNAQETQNLLTSSSRTFNHYTYKDQVDNYGQYHYQLHGSHRFSENLTANLSLHSTLGKGYYEEFKPNANFSRYGLPDATIGAETVSSADLVRRRWLDNTFYGLTYALSWEKDRFSSVLGGGWNRYSGDHFGEITWSAVAVNMPKDYRYYFNNGDKKDFNIYWKNSLDITEKLTAFADVQLRTIRYKATGTENELQQFNVSSSYNFFNPKVGLTYQRVSGEQLYASWAVANREPVREDFVNAPTGQNPLPERLKDFEAGVRKRGNRYQLQVNYYYMNYRDQLVLTGQLNDVGAAIRANVPDSYRTGVEVDATIQLTNAIRWSPNITVSRNRIKSFTEVMYDYGVNYDTYLEVRKDYQQTHIAYSPDLIAGSSWSFRLGQRMEATLLSKYVGKQYLDNTSNEARTIGSYLVNDIRLNYSIPVPGMREVGLSLLLNNVLDEKYASNGYTWGYYSGPQSHRQNYFYPQAGRNFLAMVTMKF